MQMTNLGYLSPEMLSNGAFEPPKDSDIILTDSSGTAILEDANQMDSLAKSLLRSIVENHARSRGMIVFERGGEPWKLGVIGNI